VVTNQLNDVAGNGRALHEFRHTAAWHVGTGRSLPNDLNSVACQVRILRYERHFLRQRLGRQYTVERIPVDIGQVSQCQHMFHPHP
jgi:hypothetical protein